MRLTILLTVILILAGCMSASWKRDAVGAAELSESELELMRRASSHFHLPAVGLMKIKEGVILVLLSRDPYPSGGIAVWFENENGVWVEKESGSWDQ